MPEASAPPPTADAGSCTYDPKDVPEPVAPRVECIFTREVRCVPQFPVTAAYQRWFPYCPRTIPPRASSPYPARADFSPVETCKHPTECCYVEFVAKACR